MAVKTRARPKATILKCPWPYMGAKGRVARICWEALGDASNFIDPFAGSNAILLGRPGGASGRETVNDVNAFCTNFWRATQFEPESVAEFADWPVSEMDMHARHEWLCRSESSREFISKMKHDQDYYDAKFAGYWAWGQCCWIGGAWCDQDAAEKFFSGVQVESSVGLHAKGPQAEGKGVNAKGWRLPEGRPQLADAFARGRGVHSNDSAMTCDERREWLLDWFKRLRDRLRTVRVCCGDWKRVVWSNSVTTRLGLTGIVFDPPYHEQTGRAKKLYSSEDTTISTEVRQYCFERGSDKRYRIVLFGMEGEHNVLESVGWMKLSWKSSGYQNRSKDGLVRAARERIWLSPHCVTPGREAMPLFDSREAT